MFTRPRFLPDNFVIGLVSMVVLASVFPCKGPVAHVLEQFTGIAISVLFFLHGAKLSREAAAAGMLHWRLHLVVLAATFAMFPLLGLGLQPLLNKMLGSDLTLGILFLCALPSTVQSSIAMTSIACGNVPAAVCSASVSNLIGIFLTPILVGMIFSTRGIEHSSLDATIRIVVQLLLPFIAGQVARRWIGEWVARCKSLVKVVDQGSILLVVYTAFSEAVLQGLWQQLQPKALAILFVADALLLVLALGITIGVSRWLRFSRPDEATVVFCGSKKSLASGVPMAKVLFAGPAVGVMVLPLMLYHQMQLMVCAMLASRYARTMDKT